MKLNKLYTLLIVAFMFISAYPAEITTLLSGNWSDPTVWSAGVVPTASDNVTINDTHLITLDVADAAVNNLTVGNGISGSFLTSKTLAGKLIINGNLVIMAGGTFKTQTSTVGLLLHTLTIYGNITNNGGFLALRNGSTSASPQTLAVMNTVFLGATNSTVTMGAYITSTNTGFNGITLNKTGVAKVVLGSDMICAGAASAAASADPIFTFTNGLLETGAFTIVCQSTTTATVGAGSATSYISGNLARGMSNSAGKLGTFPIGDSKGYRPVQVKTSTSGVATGHYVRVGCISGNANNSSVFSDGLIDKVSSVRYFKVSYGRLPIAAAAPDTIGIDSFRPSYGDGDGVGTGNSNLRTAYSFDERATWLTLHDNYPDVTAPSATPVYLPSDTLVPAIFVKENGKSIYFTLARLTGTTDNTLTETATLVRENQVAKSFVLEQNYPNPFNPSTSISYEITSGAMTSLKIYDVMGREVSLLVNEFQQPGRYTARFNASSLASGVYMYKLTSGNFSITKKMSLLK